MAYDKSWAIQVKDKFSTLFAKLMAKDHRWRNNIYIVWAKPVEIMLFKILCYLA